MNTKDKLNTLQLFFIGDEIEAFENYKKLDAAGLILKKRSLEQQLAAQDRIEAFNLKNEQDVFKLFESVFGYAKWEKVNNGGEISYVVMHCKVKDIAESLGVYPPCKFICIDPVSTLCNALEISKNVEVIQTLFETNKCIFNINNKKQGKP